VSRASRIAIAACWLIVAFLLARMAWGGSLFGIVYVVDVSHPAALVAGAATILGALTVAALLAKAPTHVALRSSIALSLFAVPFSIVLTTQEHGSAPAVVAAAVTAMALSLRAALAAPSGVSPPGA
jgi:hypothetical protein